LYIRPAEAADMQIKVKIWILQATIKCREKESFAVYDFSGKYAVVTGGGRGIGEAIVRRLVAEQVSGVAILDVLDSAAYAQEIDPKGEKIFFIRCNITDRADVKAAFQKIFERFGRVDFMINNAGIARDAMFHKMSDEQWDLVLGVDLSGAYNCTRQVINPMRRQEYGRIIFISSIAIYGAVGQSNYAAAKGGLYAMTKTLAKEEGRKNITVNCVIPGPVDTDLLATAPMPSGPDAPRIGKPAEIANLICFLCSDEASYINGARIDINGGLQ
jgi:3-oxoacyl-[acyl-carrier protein] reductase